MGTTANVVIVFAEIVGATDKAVRLTDGVKTDWFPRSQVKETNEGVWTMPEWLADKKGFAHD